MCGASDHASSHDITEPLLVADVAVPVPGSRHSCYSYSIPSDMRGAARPGVPVVAPLQGRDTIGFLIRLRPIAHTDPLAARLLELSGVIEDGHSLSQSQLALCEWLSDRLLCTMLEAARVVAPAFLSSTLLRKVALNRSDTATWPPETPGANSSTTEAVIGALEQLGGEATVEALQAKVGPDGLAEALKALARSGIIIQSVVIAPPKGRERLVRCISLAGSTADSARTPTDAARRVLSLLSSNAGAGTVSLPVSDVLRAANVTRSVVSRLLAQGELRCSLMPVRRVPLAISSDRTETPRLNPDQVAAVGLAVSAMQADKSDRRPVLIHGVTGSGKTEVYLEAIRHARQTGRGAIFLVPEIALATQIVDVVMARFGDDVAVLHSRLGVGERFDEWQRVADGAAGIAVGARSAVFAPVRNLGLIVIDEEHETSYKQESAPRYHARDVATERVRREDAALVMGSATPSVEVYRQAERGRVALAVLPSRISGRPLPEVRIVDMRDEFRSGAALFSPLLVEEMRARVGTGEQIVLFLNRRGYAQFVLCRDCGYVERCPNCAVSLTFHAEDRSMRCHHCGMARGGRAVCPTCQGPRLKAFGLGTERIEHEVQRLFPSARIARMDRDTTARKGTHGEIIGRIRSGDADILVGTQMVAKGFDFPRVTLVGVVSADTGLHVPDFRAAERTFQLLTQVAGRAGRGDRPGLVIVQTFAPENECVQTAARQDYAAFYANELSLRRELRYPPFARLANVVASHPDEAEATMAAQSAAEAVKSVAESDIEVLGPSPAPLARLRGRHRWHVVVRSAPRAPLVNVLREALGRVPSRHARLLHADIDPISLS